MFLSSGLVVVSCGPAVVLVLVLVPEPVPVPVLAPVLSEICPFTAPSSPSTSIAEMRKRNILI
jgi:hypothetical protein